MCTTYLSILYRIYRCKWHKRHKLFLYLHRASTGFNWARWCTEKNEMPALLTFRITLIYFIQMMIFHTLSDIEEIFKIIFQILFFPPQSNFCKTQTNSFSTYQLNFICVFYSVLFFLVHVAIGNGNNKFLCIKKGWNCQ